MLPTQSSCPDFLTMMIKVQENTVPAVIAKKDFPVFCLLGCGMQKPWLYVFVLSPSVVSLSCGLSPLQG